MELYVGLVDHFNSTNKSFRIWKNALEKLCYLYIYCFLFGLFQQEIKNMLHVGIELKTYSTIFFWKTNVVLLETEINKRCLDIWLKKCFRKAMLLAGFELRTRLFYDLTFPDKCFNKNTFLQQNNVCCILSETILQAAG